MQFLDRFESLVHEKDYKEIARLFDEYTKGELKEPEEFVSVLQLLSDAKLKNEVGSWIEKGLRFWKFLDSSDLKYRSLKLMVDLQSTNSKELASECLAVAADRFGQSENFNLFLRLCGLRDGLHFESALSFLELLTHLEPGAFVFHTGGWGTGEVISLSMVREEVEIEFENLMGTKSLSFKNARSHLFPLAKEHFLARRFGDADALEAFAKDDPASALRLFLRDMGPRSAGEIKEEFLDLVIPEADWAKWWQSARAKLKKDPLIEVPDQLSEPFILRETEVSPEERLYKTLEKSRDPSQTIVAIYTFVRDFPASAKNDEVSQSIFGRLDQLEKGGDLTEGQKIEVAFLKEELSSAPSGELIKLEEGCDVVHLVDSVEILSFKKRLLMQIKEQLENWSALFIDLIGQVSQVQLKDYILEQLIDAGRSDLIEQRMRELLLRPHSDPYTFFWFFGKVASNSAGLLEKPDDKLAFFEGLFALLYEAERNSDLRDLVKKIHACITLDRFKLTRDLLALSSKAQAEEILLLASKCQTFAEHEQKIFHSLAEVEHASLGKKESASAHEPIWMTREGYLKVQEKIKHLANVEIVDNAREIEEARSHGDLRENAEFKFALERRARLQGELKTLSDQLSSSAMLGPDDVDKQNVSVGCIVEIEGPKGAQTYTILGPVEADSEKCILSFQSLLAKAMLGKKRGESFVFRDQKYQVNSFKSYFD